MSGRKIAIRVQPKVQMPVRPSAQTNHRDWWGDCDRREPAGTKEAAAATTAALLLWISWPMGANVRFPWNKSVKKLSHIGSFCRGRGKRGFNIVGECCD